MAPVKSKQGVLVADSLLTQAAGVDDDTSPVEVRRAGGRPYDLREWRQRSNGMVHPASLLRPPANGDPGLDL